MVASEKVVILYEEITPKYAINIFNVSFVRKIKFEGIVLHKYC